jgi:hypothetical protein
MTKTDIALLATAATIALIAALAGNASADPAKPSCIDTSRSYVARSLNANEVWVQNSIGVKKPPIRVATSCHHLQATYAISLSGQFTCLSLGDPVVATAGGERQSCRVTNIQVYTPQDGDVPEKK